MDQHELHSALLNLAQELGRTPTKDEFCGHVKDADRALRKFYSRRYSDLLLAAGLDLNPHTKPRITNEIFRKDIEKHLEDYKPKEIQRSKQYPKILIVGDIHFPFHHIKCLEAIHEFAKETQPDYIVQIGDLYDCYSHSRFPKSSSIFTPLEEEKMARSLASKMWKMFRLDCLNAKLVQILGNHDVRGIKSVISQMPQIEHWVEEYFKNLMSFEGVETILDPREEYKIEDIIFTHGHLTKLGDHRDYYLNNLVVGHSHTGGVVFKQIHEKVLWEINSGFVGDSCSKGLSYSATRTVKWTLGWGFIDSYGPRFIPY